MANSKMLHGFVRSVLVAWLAAGAAGAQVVINEVLFMTDSASADAIRTHQWLELYNKGTDSADLTNWVVSGRGGSVGPSARTLPAISLPPGGYLVIHFASGQNQLAFSNGSGDYYTGDDSATRVWDWTTDEVALYSTAGIVDFLAWATAFNPYAGGVAAADAVAANIWQQGQFLNANYIAKVVAEPGRIVTPGISIGRDAASTDTDSPLDFDVPGGRDALDISPGRQNADQFLFNAISESDLTARKLARAAGIPAKWTVLLYFAVDNNLSEGGLSFMNQIADLGGLDPNVNYVALLDFVNQGQHQTIEGRLVRINPQNHGLDYVAGGADNGRTPSHQNTGDPTVLRNFIKWAKSAYPAQRYALVIHSHGQGWKGIVEDDGSPGSHDPYDTLFMGEVKSALSGSYFDLIAMHACMMAGIEVAAQVQFAADYLVASEDNLLNVAFPYSEIVQSLKANPDQDGRTLGSGIVDWVAARLTNGFPQPEGKKFVPDRWTISLLKPPLHPGSQCECGHLGARAHQGHASVFASRRPQRQCPGPASPGHPGRHPLLGRQFHGRRPLRPTCAG